MYMPGYLIRKRTQWHRKNIVYRGTWTIVYTGIVYTRVKCIVEKGKLPGQTVLCSIWWNNFTLKSYKPHLTVLAHMHAPIWDYWYIHMCLSENIGSCYLYIFMYNWQAFEIYEENIGTNEWANYVLLLHIIFPIRDPW